MLNQEELKRLQAIDTEKVAWAIGAACKSVGDVDRAIIAAAYVLKKSLEDYQISIDSMDYYFQTAKESEIFLYSKSDRSMLG